MDKNVVELKDEERTHCEIWTRVMGYCRPVSSFNKGKQSEYRDRKYFKEQCDCSGSQHPKGA